MFTTPKDFLFKFNVFPKYVDTFTEAYRGSKHARKNTDINIFFNVITLCKQLLNYFLKLNKSWNLFHQAKCYQTIPI